MSLISRLVTDIHKDDYFKELFDKVEKNTAKSFFNLESDYLDEKELVDLMRFGDILSRSSESWAKNRAYQIISMLADKEMSNPVFRFFADSILLKLGNFPAITFLNETDTIKHKQSAEFLIERSIKEVYQKIPKSDFTFTDAQYEIFEKLKSNNHFSFSGPTSLGKSFIINAFIRFLITEHKKTDNIIILVPTRALINQTIIKLKKEFSDVKEYKILAHPNIPNFYKNPTNRYLFVFTPERLLAYLSNLENPKIDYLFIDEAQKIISEKDTRSALYYFAILRAERKNIKLFFASPNIPNPEIFLQLFEKSTEENLSVTNSPVSQNRYFLDFIARKCSLIREDGSEEKIPIDFNQGDFHFWLKKLTAKDKSIVYCNTKEDTINYSLDFAKTLPPKVHPQIDDVVKLVQDYLHKDYFLIECLKHGVAFHFGSLPQRIREKVEYLFNERIIDYVFCTSTLLEGVNLPAKNIFILSNAIGLSKFTDIDFWNLAGRAGRLTKELSGNIICTRVIDKKNRWDSPEKDLAIVKSKSIRRVEPLLISGKKNFFENVGASLSDSKRTKKSPTSNEISLWNQFANIALIHEIRSDDSVLLSNFISKNPEAQKILNLQKRKNIVPEHILGTTPTIKAKYQNQILASENLDDFVLGNEISYQIVLQNLKILAHFYNWKDEESIGKDPMYKSEKSLSYYATIMNNWLNSTPLNLMISNTIIFYKTTGVIYNNRKEPIIFNSSNPYHINQIINELIGNIDNILRFKLKNYFENFYLLLNEKFGSENAGYNWAEYLEYGTTDHEVIELQNIGVPRHLALFILKKHPSFAVFENEILIEFDFKGLIEAVKETSTEYTELIEIFGSELDD